MIDSEKIIIGHLLRFPETAPEIAEGLQPEDFSSQRLGIIFKAVQTLTGKRFDAITLSSTLRAWSWDIPISELLGFEDFAIDGVSLDSAKQEIKAEAQKRALIYCLRSSLQKIEKPGSDLTEIQDDLSRDLLELQAGVSTDATLKRPSDFRDEILYQKSSHGMLTGLQQFDRLIAGLRPNELTVLTGETSSGKTTFAAAFLPFVLSQKGHPILIASFEMKPASIQRKMVQMAIGHRFDDLSLGEREKGLDLVEDLPLHFIDAYGQMGLKELKANIFRAHREFKIDLVVLDHLHFFLRYSGDQERQAIDQALRDIKAWSMDLGIHIILVVHPTKLTFDNKVVHLNDLKGSSGLKQIPDNVLSIWRSRKEDDLKTPRNEIILYILKVRDDSGDEGKTILVFDKRSQSYSDSGPNFTRAAERHWSDRSD